MEYIKQRLLVLLGLLLFFGSVVAVVIGQKRIGYEGALIMLLGLCGMILCIYAYNRNYK